MFIDSYLVAIGAVITALAVGAIILVSQAVGFEDYLYIYLGLALVVGSWGSIRHSQNALSFTIQACFNWRLKRRQRSKDILDKLDF